jgi:hypothetical protein
MALFGLLTWANAALGQATNIPVVPTGALPTDVTPIRIREERELFRPGPSLYLFQRLPANLWFNTSSEINLRYESNVFLTANQPKRDMVFRTFPNVTVGYNFLKNVGVYSNYFMIKDIYADTAPGTAHLTQPVTQSVSLGVRHNRQIGQNNLQFDMQARELWQARKLHQFDYLPGFLLSRPLGKNTFGFINLQLQMRGGQPFVAPTRELDPFYTFGVLRSFGIYTLSVTNTFITDFRSPPFNHSVPMHSNYEDITDVEIYRPILKRYSNVVAFVRAEPIWNWHSNRQAGLSGFDFRVYSGIRIQFAKPPVGSLINQMRKGLKSNPDNPTGAPENAPIPPAGTVQPIPNSSLPGDNNVASKSVQAVVASSAKPSSAKRPVKLSFMDKLKQIALGPADAPETQNPILMIPNQFDPTGPMIPTWAPTAPPISQWSQVQQAQQSQQSQQQSPQSQQTIPVVLRGKMESESTSKPTSKPGESRIPLPDNDGLDAATSNRTAPSNPGGQPLSTSEIPNSNIADSPNKTAVFTSNLDLGKTLDSSDDFLRSRSLLPLVQFAKID